MFNSKEKLYITPENTERELKPLTAKRIKEEGSYNNLRYGFARHDDATYSQNEMIPRSSEPLQSFEKSAQVSADLSTAGRKHAYRMANEFFDNFNPQTNEIAITSSALTRSRETAAIYLEVAKDRGFDIKVIAREDKHGHINLLDLPEYEEKISSKRKVPRGQIPEELFKKQGGTEIRTLGPLSLDNIKQMFIEFLFNNDNYMAKVQTKYKNKIPPEYRDLWQQARAIIEKDNKGNWGTNFLTYSEQLQELFDKYRQEHNLDKNKIPHFASAKDMYENNFRNALRLMARYDDAIDSYEAEQTKHKKVRVLGFGHENQLLYFLKKEFGKIGVDKGEVIGFKLLKDEQGKKHFIVSLPREPNNPKEIEFPHSPSVK